MPNEEMKVLVIEDEESFITALKVGLTREGFTVEVQSDGAEALNTFKTSTQISFCWTSCSRTGQALISVETSEK